MRHYITEIVLCTIVAAVVTILFYLIGADKTSQEAATTFGTCFLVMFVIGLWKHNKNNDS